MSPVGVITLAAIVQRETAKVDERPTVAGVYMNRLRKGMKLDADPTVIFAVKRQRNDWGLKIRRVLAKDLKTQDPYNTYRNKGLPPGPIYMPDVSSIEAVLNHERHDYLFFVANPQRYGYHLFSKTYAQHRNFSKLYHNWIQKKGIKR